MCVTEVVLTKDKTDIILCDPKVKWNGMLERKDPQRLASMDKTAYEKWKEDYIYLHQDFDGIRNNRWGYERNFLKFLNNLSAEIEKTLSRYSTHILHVLQDTYASVYHCSDKLEAFCKANMNASQIIDESNLLNEFGPSQHTNKQEKKQSSDKVYNIITTNYVLPKLSKKSCMENIVEYFSTTKYDNTTSSSSSSTTTQQLFGDRTENYLTDLMNYKEPRSISLRSKKRKAGDNELSQKDKAQILFILHEKKTKGEDSVKSSSKYTQEMIRNSDDYYTSMRKGRVTLKKKWKYVSRRGENKPATIGGSTSSTSSITTTTNENHENPHHTKLMLISNDDNLNNNDDDSDDYENLFRAEEIDEIMERSTHISSSSSSTIINNESNIMSIDNDDNNNDERMSSSNSEDDCSDFLSVFIDDTIASMKECVNAKDIEVVYTQIMEDILGELSKSEHREHVKLLGHKIARLKINNITFVDNNKDLRKENEKLRKEVDSLKTALEKMKLTSQKIKIVAQQQDEVDSTKNSSTTSFSNNI